MTLPNTLSELLALAIEDMRVIAKDPRYELDMNLFHSPIGDKCYVCLAGSVMARTLKLPPGENYIPDEFDKDTFNKLYALDALRIGDLVEAAFELGIKEEPIAAAKLAEQYANLKAEIQSVLNSVRTTKRLLEVWPEAEALIPPPPPPTTALAPDTTKLNTILELP
jgi:hypothetical protein